MRMLSKCKKSLSGVTAGVLFVASSAMLSFPAIAGNIFLTGHDDDFHGHFGDLNARAQLSAGLGFVRSGSTTPTLGVLSFDAGSELTGELSALGVTFTNVNPSAVGLAAAGGAALFDPTLYSAFIVASVTTCGGCDNPVGTGSNIAAYSAAITSFFNAGGGIFGLSGASDSLAYAYVPTSATNGGGFPPSSGYVQTAAGALLGIPAVNGDPTHNFFNTPGTGGLSAAYSVVETLGVGGKPESIALKGGTITCTGPACTISVPEPGTLSLLGLGLLGFGFARRRKAA